jgi:hypothetical protein
MMRRQLKAELLSVLFAICSAHTYGQQPPVVIVIENVGASDRAIIPIIISTSEEGLALGRSVVLRDTGLGKVQTYIVPNRLETRLVKSIRAIRSDGADSLKLLGNLCFVVIPRGNDAQPILVKRTNGIKVLRELESLAPQGELKSDLADMRSQLEMIGGWPGSHE